MTNWAQGFFTPKNPSKYVGKGNIRYRSSWELSFMMMCDTHPSILNWASESIKIPYKHPVTGKNTIYVPDFFILYEDANGKRHADLVEIKPLKQTMMEGNRSEYNKMVVLVNMAKWDAARKFCAVNNINFKIVTENELFHTGKKTVKNKKRKRK